MAGIFTRPEIDKIMNDSELTPEQRTERVFSLYGRALDEGYVSKRDAENAKNAAIEAARAGIKAPEPVDPKTTKEYLELQRERDMLRAIGGEDFASVKPKFRETVFNMLDRAENAAPVADQLKSIGEKYEEYFTADATPKAEDAPKGPAWGAPTQGSAPTGKTGPSFMDTWGFIPKK